jgi:predicted transposase/invertase (TIGR01784 family)
MYVNREHKSSVFSELFRDPGVLRELYAAIGGIEIPLNIPIDVNTLSKALINGKWNDVSFTIDDRLVVLVEHQSSVNNNMPLRLLQYITGIYQGMTDNRALLQRKLVKIPEPEFIVLYNGTEPYPEKKEIRLSEAFKNTEDLKLPMNGSMSLELVAQVYNINYESNAELLKKSETLDGYSLFISKIREFSRIFPLEKAVKTAVKYCIEHDVLKSYLKRHSQEVLNMMIEEITIEDEIAAAREDGREDGLTEGRQEGREEQAEEIAKKALAKNIPIETVMEITGLDLETVKKIQSGMQK